MRLFLSSLVMFLAFITSAHAAFTSPTNPTVASDGNFTLSWNDQPNAAAMGSLGGNSPRFKLKEQKLNTNSAPQPVTLPGNFATSISFSGKAVGAYEYTLEVLNCSSFSGCWYSVPPAGRIIVTVVNSSELGGTLSAGSTPYTATVNSKGEAVISVPINIPEGRAGMHPQLSLNFNSSGVSEERYRQNASGWLGFGWGLSGIPNINRCTIGNTDVSIWIKPQDSTSGKMIARPRLQYNDTDNLCLDGDQLILVAGTPFRVGAQYRTYNESFRLITIKGTDAEPWFEVRNPNGSVAIYGKESNTKIRKITTPGGTVATPYFVWSIDSETDTFGNKISYSYTTKDESFSYQPNKQRVFPSSIQYPGGLVKFEYMYVTLPPETYTKGDDGPTAGIDRYRFNNDGSHQLSKVVVQRNSSAEPKTYWIDGSGQTAEQIKWSGIKVGSIKECSGIEAVQTCLPPLSFKWVLTGALAWHKLESITDSLGVVTKFDYREIGGYDSNVSDNYTMPHPFPMPATTLPKGKKSSTLVVESLYKSTALAPDNFHRTIYNYYGNGEESVMGRGFLGFRAIATHDLASAVSTYRQYSTKTSGITGSLDLAAEQVYGPSYTQPGAALLSKVEYRPNFQAMTYANGGKTYLPLMDQITTFNYEKGIFTGASIKNNSYTIDAAGGLISSIVTTTTTGANLDAMSFTPQYWGDNAAYTLTPSAIKNTHVKTITMGNSTSVTDWRIGYTTREQHNFHNGAIGYATDTKMQEVDYTMKAGTTLVETTRRFNGDASYHLLTTYNYNSYGQQTSVIVTGSNVESRTTSLNYYSANIEPDTITNALGYIQSNSDFDQRFGMPRTITDANGVITTQEFDAFGRVKSTSNGGTIVTQNYLSCTTSSCSSIPGKLGNIAPVYVKEVSSNSAPTVREYYDSRGRVIRTEKAGFTSGYWVKTDVQYNELGQVYKTSLPYLSGTAQYLVNTYDNRGRLIKVVQPDGTEVSTDYATANIVASETWLKVTVTEQVKNASGVQSATNKKITYLNGAGQLMQVIDAADTAQETTTSYEYDSLGNIVKTIVNGGTDGTSTSTALYDKAGNRTSMTDPNAGTVTSLYTALGELREVTDNKGNITTYTYDKLGRNTIRTSIDGTFNWEYDPVGGKGMLSSMTNNNGYRQTYTYAAPGLPGQLSSVETTITVPGLAAKTFIESLTYDSYGRVKQSTSPSGYTVSQQYNAQGYGSGLWRGNNWYPISTINKIGAFGVEEETANGFTTKRTFDAKSGRIASIKTDYVSGTKIQDLSYQWYSNGSLQSKTNSQSGTAIVDAYTYDAHDRLKTTATAINSTTQRTLTQGYNKLGNVTGNTSTVGSDSQVTGYQYGTTTNAGPHAVSVAVIKGISNTLHYDKNGAITHYDATSGSDKYIAYNSMNQPTTITVGTSLADANPVARDEFRYNPDGARYYKKSTYLQNGVQRTEHTFYIGSYETTYYDTSSSVFQNEKTTVSNLLHIRKTPYVGSVVETQQHLHLDHLGSVDAVTAPGAVVANLAFEPYGVRRNSTTFTGNISSAQLTEIFNKHADLPTGGYTGHESLDRTGFIHMNGRVYDPQLARFLSPDPLVQAPTNSQSWNRYSYVFNNPLKYTDPSGYQAVEEMTVTGHGCNEKCQRQGYAKQFMDAFTRVGMTTTASGEVNFKGKTFSATDPNLLLKLIAVQAGGGSKTDTNNVLGVLAEANSSPTEEQIKEWEGNGIQPVGIDLAIPVFKGLTLLKTAGKSAKEAGEELFGFSKAAATHMDNPDRAVPIQILDMAIKNSKGLPDPRGSKALMHTIPMKKNGREYNLEVLHDKQTNSIWHFKYF